MDTITALSKLCISHNGHLPTSIPESQASHRTSPLVQLCHGTPPLLYLLGQVQNNNNLVDSYKKPEWAEAIRLGTERIWQEGLLSKGGGLCHGIAGNAWPWLVLHDGFKYEPRPFQGRTWSGDHFLSQALAFLIEATKTPPFGTSEVYRMPHKPYSLFEGLAGTICAWAEACVVIVTRLRMVEVEDSREWPWDGIPLWGQKDIDSGYIEDGFKDPRDGFAEDDLFNEHLGYQLGLPTMGASWVKGVL